jgi:hypothetical protein
MQKNHIVHRYCNELGLQIKSPEMALLKQMPSNVIQAQLQKRYAFLKINPAAKLIQNLLRRVIVKKKSNLTLAKYNKSALKIQTQWRHHLKFIIDVS